MDGAREYNAKWNKSAIERQILYDSTHVWYLINKTNKLREKKRKREGETSQETHSPPLRTTDGS